MGSAYSFPGLQKKRGVSYDPERDLPAIRSCAAGELVELPPRATEQLVGVSPKGDEQLVEATPPGSEQLEMPLPVEVPPSTTEQLVLLLHKSDEQLEEVSPAVGGDLAELPPDEPEVTRAADYSVASPSIREKLKQTIDAAAADYPSMPELIAKLYSTGVRVEVEFSSQGFPKGISYDLDEISTAGSNLGKQYSFGGLQIHLGVDYNPEWDNRLIETLMHYSREGRAIDDSYMDRLRRYRQTLEQEARRMHLVNQLLGMGVEEELPMAIAKPGLNKGIAAPVIDAAFQPTALTSGGDITSSVTIGGDTGDNATSSSVASTLNSGNPAIGDGDTDTNNLVARQEATQQQNYASSFSPTIRLFWNKVGQPETYSGKHYDLQIDGDILKLRRKSGEEIAEIPLNANAEGKDKGLTKEDLVRMERLKALLLTQSRQQEYHNQVDME